MRLYESFPIVKPHLFYCKGYLKNAKKLAVPRVRGANPAMVGTAYDFCCRAITQQINGILLEERLSPVLELGLRRLFSLDLNYNKEISEMRKTIEDAWQRRIDYIKGELIPVSQLAVDALKMARVEQVHRSGIFQDDPVTNENVEDLVNLCMGTIASASLLQTKEEIFMNVITRETKQSHSSVFAL